MAARKYYQTSTAARNMQPNEKAVSVRILKEKGRDCWMDKMF